MHTRFLAKVVGPVPAWADLSTVTTFDSGSIEDSNAMSEKDIVVKNFAVSPSSLLIESLVEHLCKLLKSDPDEQRRLYESICNNLYRMKLITSTYKMEEMSSLRRSYQASLLRLVTTANMNVGDNDSNNMIALPLPDLEISTSIFETFQSRYEGDYVELEFIAKGGFGQVYRVRHKLDGGEYAIKKIFLRCRNIQSFEHKIQEVKLLAQMNHPNIVSYKAAWIEPCFLVKHKTQNVKEENISEDVSVSASSSSEQKYLLNTSVNDESNSIIFKYSQSELAANSSNEINNSHKDPENRDFLLETSTSFEVHSHINTPSESRISHFIESSSDFEETCEEEAVESISQDRVVCRRLNEMKYEWEKREWATLFIQMQLCKGTLRSWLDQRNSQLENDKVDTKESLNIFRNIVQGVAYIHSQEIVHHDIKPSNIFMNGSNTQQVQVGDFGLACVHCSTDSVTLMRPHCHKGEIGTPLYAAPEQLKGKCYLKSDMYSLGVVLIELLQPFKTDMERNKVLHEVRGGVLPSNISQNLSYMVPVIQALLSPELENRPSAENLLKDIDSILRMINEETRDSLTLANNETIDSLLAEINKKQEEVEELRRKVKALQKYK